MENESEESVFRQWYTFRITEKGLRPVGQAHSKLLKTKRS